MGFEADRFPFQSGACESPEHRTTITRSSFNPSLSYLNPGKTLLTIGLVFLATKTKRASNVGLEAETNAEDVRLQSR